jgi:hypothetical protein
LIAGPVSRLGLFLFAISYARFLAAALPGWRHRDGPLRPADLFRARPAASGDAATQTESARRFKAQLLASPSEAEI